jgi:hypothetical protein
MEMNESPSQLGHNADAMRSGLEEVMLAAGETPERQAARNARIAELCAQYPGQFVVIREEWDGAQIVEPFLLAVAPTAIAAEEALKNQPPELAAGAAIEYLMPRDRAMVTRLWNWHKPS